MAFRFSWRKFALLYLILFALAYICREILDIILLNFSMNIYMNFKYGDNLIFIFATMLTVIIVISLFHELIHGLVYKVFGGRVQFGYKIMYAYTREVSGIAISRLKFTVILLAPIFFISIFTLLLPKWLGEFVLTYNILGSVGDLFMTCLMLKFKQGSRIIDRIGNMGLML